ncbi:MAG: Asr1405/Asl0597 family protein, partial [Cyanobacteria bacterium J06635_1]
MTPQSASQSEFNPLFSVNCVERWQVYFRLQALDIPCRCQGYCPLEVEVTTPHAAIQLWSVVAWASKPRLELANRLERCWQL